MPDVRRREFIALLGGAVAKPVSENLKTKVKTRGPAKCRMRHT
jgi:hypothetical protein